MQSPRRAMEEETPFEVPSDYRFEPEFNSPTPRPLPDFVYRGRFVKHQRLAQGWLLLLGSLLVLAHFLPTTQRLALTVPPMAWLILPGIACFVAFVVSWQVIVLRRSTLRYLTVGIPVVAEVLRVHGTPSFSPMLQHINVCVRLRHPDTGEVVRGNFSAITPVDSGPDKALGHPSPGDFVTTVHLPDAFDTSLELYGFLGLNPDIEFVAKSNEMAWVTAILILGLAFVGVAMPLGFDAIDRMYPIAIPNTAWLPLIVGDSWSPC